MSDDRAAIEQWFLRRGIPHFIEDYRAASNVWVRAAPWFPLAYLVGALNGINRQYGFWKNVGAMVGAIAILVLAWALTNVLRGRRPVLGRPTRIGPAELAVFVLGPSLPALLFGQQWRSAIASAAIGLGVLVLLYAATSYGLVPMIRWALARLVDQIGALGNLFIRATPLLLIFITFTFLAAELWQVTANLVGYAYPATLSLFVILGALFAVSRVPQDVRAIGRFESWDEVREVAGDSPAQQLGITTEGTPDLTPTNWRQWLNVTLLLLFTRAVQITLVAVAVGVFLALFGVLAIPAATIGSWVGHEPHSLVTLTADGRAYVLTEELLRTCGFLSAFSGLYFTVYLLTDPVYREEFRADVVGEVRQAFAVRALYSAAVTSPDGAR